ncbi:MAG: hypothetical protein ACI8RN_001737 [Glaciecola sp.]|jgi:hypothetical protein|uniref:hypothetical protein n=1 Tax=Congregibacter sp. TaxID=2744308 RepID=UPI0039E2A56D
MRRLLLGSSVLAVVLGSGSLWAQEASDPDTWYRTVYAPLWGNTPAADAEKLLLHYSSTITTHNDDGTVTADERRAWLVEPMAGWTEEGWLRAELLSLETQDINASTASFVAQWKDHYRSGDTEVSCGWYLADLTGGQWIITAYADTQCN